MVGKVTPLNPDDDSPFLGEVVPGTSQVVEMRRCPTCLWKTCGAREKLLPLACFDCLQPSIDTSSIVYPHADLLSLPLPYFSLSPVAPLPVALADPPATAMLPAFLSPPPPLPSSSPLPLSPLRLPHPSPPPSQVPDSRRPCRPPSRQTSSERPPHLMPLNPPTSFLSVCRRVQWASESSQGPSWSASSSQT